CVGDQQAVAAPGHRLPAHDHDATVGGQVGEAVQAGCVLRGQGVVGVVLEAGVLPSGVERGVDIPLLRAPAGELGQVQVLDPCLTQPRGHLVGVELGAAA